VHALSYPLGGEFHIAHGLSNAILLPGVFRFNAQSTPDRHAKVAIALGVSGPGTEGELAERGAEQLECLTRACGVETKLSTLGIAKSSIPGMAQSAISVTRLLKKNPRTVSQADAEQIYLDCF